MLTDPIADMLTRIRNGGTARRTAVVVPESRLKRQIAELLHARGYLASVDSDDDPKKPTLTLGLRYGGQNRPLIEGLERVSRPSRRVYVDVGSIPKVRNGLGMAILSTPRGILSDEQAREARVGGEVLARVW